MSLNEIDKEIEELKQKRDKVQGTKTEVYTRIVGYHRAIDSWNKGKREEFRDRKEFKVEG